MQKNTRLSLEPKASAILPSGICTTGWVIRDLSGKPQFFQESGIGGLKIPANQLRIVTDQERLSHER